MNDSQLADLLNTLSQSSMHMAGVDEAGRGPLAGPVVAAAVILDTESPIEGLADSKKLSAKKRAALELLIKERSLSWALGRAEIDEIEELNILHASMLAMKRAVESLDMMPAMVLIDGNRCPDVKMKSRAIIKGDQRVEAISAASILAKESRDREMIQLDEEFPGYGFAVHKGYPTRAHIQALKEIGVSSVHRRSYGPVKRILQAFS
ncbi:MAG: ribonuclease HII [Gammaproteobacteria bacterium]|nr:ribonuclease HII [Gammaproteobacteria bacterium]